MLLGKYWLFSRLGCSAGLIIKCRLRGGGDGGARGAAAPQRIVSWQADIAVLIGASDHWITEILSLVGSPLPPVLQLNQHFSLISPTKNQAGKFLKYRGYFGTFEIDLQHHDYDINNNILFCSFYKLFINN